jgi:cytochrome P450 monooxygenase
MFLHRDKEWFAAVGRIHEFLYGYIDKAMKQYHDEKAQPQQADDKSGGKRNDFLWTLMGQVHDRLEIRTQLIGVWFPSNETTSILMSNVVFALARNPQVVQRLRQDIVAYGDKPLTFEGLRSIAYLRYIINESEWCSSFQTCNISADLCEPSPPSLPG